MDIKDVKLESVKAYPKNQKKHPEEQINNIVKSIEKYGFVQPVVLSADNEIIIGHGRVLAAKKLEMESIPCVYADNLTEEQIRELRILDNKLNESEWDMELLKTDLDELDFSDFELDFSLGDEKDEPFTMEYEEDVNAPEEFKEYGEDIETKCKCPKCGYEW